MSLAEGGSGGVVAVAIGVGAGEVEAGEEGPQRRVAVDEGGDVARAILYGGPEGEEEEGEEEECGEVGGEGRRRLAEELGRAAQVFQPGVITHGGAGYA